MQLYLQELHVPNVRNPKWQDMQIPLFSRISMQEILDIRLHSVLVTLMHMVRFFLD